MNHQIYEDILMRRSGMDYSAGIRFQKSLVNMEEAKLITRKNQMGKRIRSKEENSGVAPPSTYELPQMIYLWGFIIIRPKSQPWKWGFL